ncbi:MAG: hypothetical protein K8S16_10680, partial [Bacteroidales bacterium]|nr:hypothetical protein [Bacteroidales bacterium]
MTSIARQKFKKNLKGALISGIITAVFMFLFYYQSWRSIGAGICIGFFAHFSLATYTNIFVNH